ncbi:MAG: cyclase family protein [Thermodesulfobacteriota bacterium]
MPDPTRAKYRLIDLSHPVHDDMPVYPGDERVHIHRKASVAVDGYALCTIHLSTHVGTHADAPAHMLRDGDGIGSMDLSRFFGKACVLDCRACGGTIDIVHLNSNIKRITTSEMLILRTGWDSRWGNPDYFREYPVLDLKAARLLTQTRLSAIGIDAPSFDTSESDDFPIHRMLLGAGKVLIENLRGLENLPDEGFQISAFPLSFGKDMDGSPVRAVAWIE